MGTNRLPAACYLRTSSREQQYSVDRQRAAVLEYASQHGFDIVRTYSDVGRSGVSLRRRPALQALLRDVTSGTSGLQAILVYDVSRWGRFQDADESAHYEYLCRRAGISVHYCMEEFNQAGSIARDLLKGLRRLTAAEYSRELGRKIFAAKARLAALGFRMGGRGGFGLRRLLLSADGTAQRILNEGDRKNLSTERVILVPGPLDEVRCVRKIFRLFIRAAGEKTPADIARLLNTHGAVFNNRRWTRDLVAHILRNPNYVGTNVWAQTNQRLSSPQKRTPANAWITKRNAFEPLISETTFARAQSLFRQKTRAVPTSVLMRQARQAFARHGRLNGALMKSGNGCCSPSTFGRRFGTMERLFAKLGQPYPEHRVKSRTHGRRTRREQVALVEALVRTHPAHFSVRRALGSGHPRVFVDDTFVIDLVVCPSVKPRNDGVHGWRVCVSPVTSQPCMTLLAFLNQQNDATSRLILIPELRMNGRCVVVRADSPLLATGKSISSLDEVYALATSLHSGAAIGSS